MHTRGSQGDNVQHSVKRDLAKLYSPKEYFMIGQKQDNPTVRLPADSHVHSEWSWDTATASMERSCETANRVGLPSIAFTEHADFSPWFITPVVYQRLGEQFRAMVSVDNLLTPPGLDVEGYLGAIEHCRGRFPDLK